MCLDLTETNKQSNYTLMTLDVFGVVALSDLLDLLCFQNVSYCLSLPAGVIIDDMQPVVVLNKLDFNW